MTGIRECILYRDFEQGELLEKMTMLMEDISHPKVLYGKDGEYFACIHQLVEMAGTYGFAGNLWHDYLTYLLVNHENAFSTACEIVGPVEGTINAFAMHDFEIFKQLYDFDLKELEKIYPSVDSSLITDYQNINEGSKVFNKRIRDRICTLAQKLAKAESTEEFMDDMVQFYKEFGVGKLGLHKAFRIDGTVTPARIVPITNIAHVHLDDLVGYEIAKKKLIDNTGKQDQGGLVIGTDGTVYASLKATGDLPGGIIALSPNNGEIKWQYESPESVSGTPAIDADGHILFGTEKGNFYILDSNGRDIVAALDVAGAITNSHSPYASEWLPTQGKFWSSPIIGNDGTIYIAITNVENEKQSLMVALTSGLVSGPATSAWPMKGKDPQHTSTIK